MSTRRLTLAVGCKAKNYGKSSEVTKVLFEARDYNVAPTTTIMIPKQGEDTRASSTSHLYASLQNIRIIVFKDDKSLPKGDHISYSLLVGRIGDGSGLHVRPHGPKFIGFLFFTLSLLVGLFATIAIVATHRISFALVDTGKGNHHAESAKLRHVDLHQSHWIRSKPNPSGLFIGNTNLVDSLVVPLPHSSVHRNGHHQANHQANPHGLVVGGDAFDSMEDVRFLEFVELSLDEPKLENELITENVDNA
ncbi:hypothetical protein JHK86_006744 [Glycine max]|nr:hypothetical protein JHK86_006744 [Glycine max]